MALLNENLHYETITPFLKEVLIDLMTNPLFRPFRLVGGTSLSLRFGHRMSNDIDLFTDAPYGSLDFSIFESFLRISYPYYFCTDRTNIVGFGRSYYVGYSIEDPAKIDLFYHEALIEPVDIIDNIRIASVQDIVAMKVDVVSRSGRKKDFWDLHELLNIYSIPEMLEMHELRFEYTHNRDEIIKNFTNFKAADNEIDPICLKGKDWEDIKIDFLEALDKFTSTLESC
jgi:hypothetical protein